MGLSLCRLCSRVARQRGRCQSVALRVTPAFWFLFLVDIQNSTAVLGCLPGSWVFRFWILDIIFHFFSLWK